MPLGDTASSGAFPGSAQSKPGSKLRGKLNDQIQKGSVLHNGGF
jgi:hypothetical protein